MAAQLEGDLLAAPDTYIVHQLNCVSEDAQGLASDVFVRFPHANVYTGRAQRSVPGTIVITGAADADSRSVNAEARPVVGLFAQRYPGGPKSYETREQREIWFLQCLEELRSILRPGDTIGFPFEIGCGRAGGVWERYQHMIQHWASGLPDGCSVRIYRDPRFAQ